MYDIARPSIGEVETNIQLSERDLTVDDSQAVFEFDMLAEYDNNFDTPIDHRPPPLSKEIFSGAIILGDILRGIYDGDKIVAYYWLDWKSLEQELYVSSIMVHPDYRDLGIGSYCLRVAEYEAKLRDAVKLTLTVDPLNGRGVYSYLKHGYRVRKYILDKWGPNANRLLMERDLKHVESKYGNEEIYVSCDDDDGLLDATQSGYIGIRLIRSQDGDNRKNTIEFRRPV